MSISERIFQFIKSLNISQKDFSIATGIKESSLSDIKKNKYEPSAQTLIKISEVYNVNLNWLLLNKGNMFNTEDNERRVSLSDIADYLKRLDHSINTQMLFKILLEIESDDKIIKELIQIIKKNNEKNKNK